MKRRITDVITKEETRNWKPGNDVLISAPMGAGKSYFCKNPLYDIAKEKISLSKMTFSHQMIRLIFVEQLYRAMTILNNGPYHHE